MIDSGQLGIFLSRLLGPSGDAVEPGTEPDFVCSLLASAGISAQSMSGGRDSWRGKTPHIQNLAVGGVMNAINLNSLATFNMDRLGSLQSLLQELVPFVQQAYLVDACLLAASYPEWFGYGRGVANYLAVPDLPTDAKATTIRSTRRPDHEWRPRFRTTPFKTGVTKLSAQRSPRM
jgi:hydrogenase large subunit